MEINDLLEAKASAMFRRVSSTGAVTATITRPKTIKVMLNSQQMNSIDEYTLAEDIETCVSGVIEDFAEYAKAIAQQCEKPRSEIPSCKLRQWHEQLQVQMANTIVEGKSSGGLIEVTMFGDCDLVVKILDNAVRRTNVSVTLLEQEINEAIKWALVEYSRVARSCRLRINDMLLN